MKKQRYSAVIAFLVFALTLAGNVAYYQQADSQRAEAIFAAGKQLYDDGRYKLAADTLETSTALFEKLNRKIDQVRSANLQAEALSNLGQCDVAATLLQNSLSIIKGQSGDNQAVLADTYYYLSRHAGGCARKFDDAIGLMQKSLAIKRQIYAEGDASFAFDYTFLGYIYNSKGKYDSALIYLDQALNIRKSKLPVDDIETSHTLFNLAASYEGKSDLRKALNTNLSALKIRSEKLGDSHATVSNSINSIGRIYRKLGNNERALEYYRRALEIRKSTLGANHPNVAGSYYEIGNLYGNISNYHSSVEYIQQGNRILENNSQVSRDVLPTYYAYAGKMYGLIGQHDNAKAAIQQGVSVAESDLPAGHPYRAVVYNIAGEYFGEIGDVKKQSEFFKKAIAIYTASYGGGSEREGDVISKMALTHAKLGDRAGSLELYNKALFIYKEKLGMQNPKVASVLLGIGDGYAPDNFSAADNAFRRALESCGISSKDSLHNSYPPVDQVENKPLVFRIVKSRAAAIGPTSRSSIAPTGDMQQLQLASYQFALALADEIARDYTNEAARVQLEKDKREIYSGMMNVLWDMNTSINKSSGGDLIAGAFAIAERSKAALLLENTKDNQAKTIAGVPDSLVDKERDIRIELAYHRNALYQATRNSDSVARKNLEESVFVLDRTLEKFKTQLERDYPAYFRLKYSKDFVFLQDVMQELAPDSRLLEYFVSDKYIYSFDVSSSSADFRRLVLDDSLRAIVSGYQRSLTDARFIMNEPARADSVYFSTSRSLFSLLMIPKPASDKAQRLIIIPDDFLAQFNFGTLLTSDANDGDYTNLSYLNNRYVVSYAYSAALLDDKNNRKSNNDNFAGFAPSYLSNDYSLLDSTEHPSTALAMRSGNFALPGAAEEIRILSDMMNGRSWINDEATETNFKKHGGDYDVLHLAMHSLLNDEEPRYSELLFNSDAENDGYLTIAEIYNLKFNAQLVVLSACSSGYGKIQHGEGPISLSRAFSYAGCPSVVMSLWKVPDQVTTSIMKNFYEGLTEGLSKDEALRSAQIKFTTENTDPLYRHPYYWAGFVVIGDTSPLQTNSYVAYYISAMLLLGVAVAIFIRRNKRR
jgi:CHAT domain-containing protein